MNANQVFKWRRAYERGELSEPCSALLSVKVSAVAQSPSEPAMAQQTLVAAGAVHIEFPGIAMISIESSADCSAVRQVIHLPTGTKIWIAAGVTDMWRGFDGLSAQVQTVLQQQPFSGHVFVFRGRRGDFVKLLWWDGDGLCLFAKRLERGRYIWPKADSGSVHLTRAQLSMLLEGIDWRRVERTWAPEVAV